MIVYIPSSSSLSDEGIELQVWLILLFSSPFRTLRDENIYFSKTVCSVSDISKFNSLVSGSDQSVSSTLWNSNKIFKNQ
jgi:hypothetical protein